MLEIIRILNNNVVVAVDDDETEMVLMGNGLGFKRKIGETVDSDKVEKRFDLKNSLDSYQVEKLFSEIPEKVLHFSYKILDFAKEELQKDLTDTAFISIADHLHTAIQRSQKDIHMKNFLLWDIKQFFPAEFSVAKQAIAKLNESMKVDLDEDEAGFLALHLVNAEIDHLHEDAISLTQMIEEILTVIKYTLKISFQEEDIYFQRFLTHLRYFSERVLKSGPKKNEETQVENELYTMVKRQYSEAFIATEKVVELLKSRWNYEVSKDEQVYITIHLARIYDQLRI